MNYNEVKNIVFSIIRDKLGVEEYVTENSSYSNDLGADSLDAVEIMIEFEIAFQIAISDEEFGMFERDDRVSKSIDFICSKLNIQIEKQQKMKLKCINQGNFKNITFENEYQLLEESVDLYTIINNSGVSARYSKDYFEVIPEPIPDIIEDVEEVGVKEDEIEMKFDNNIEDIEIKVNDNSSTLVFYGVASNCGIRSYHGINFLFENCDQNVDLFRKVITEVLDLIIEENCCCMTLFSTNHEYKEIWTVLDEIMDSKSEVVENPNSDRNVKLWIKYV